MASVVDAAAAYCETRRAMLLVDPPTTWTDATKAHDGYATLGTRSANAAIFFPRLLQPDPAAEQSGRNCSRRAARSPGYSRAPTAQRGVWKAPAGH